MHDGRLREALRAAASALKEGGPRFALAGAMRRGLTGRLNRITT
ncbi:hypothetical protein AB8998_22735 [Mycobacterium sp. HUMS_12744610]|uniref:Uncharacterized protein n=1 Tax=Mycobacterium servetii TaxID=3237418 RepID=A0ABV4C4X2_9MYCO